ncbi:hypothetical protein ACR30L_14785 [Psychromonas sp. PT13]|uniref:hypothetical protein n=1 Tax=Psychromonas sp. PT13 TaxID=3439547 RepID=UPI003EB9A381
MSMDLWEYQQDEVMSEYYQELCLSEFQERAIDEFTAERLSSYYVENSNLLVDSFRALEEAQKVSSLSPTSGLIMAAISIEIALKIGLLKPIVFGFVHSEAVAESISNAVVKQTGIDRFKTLLVTLLKEISHVDIVTYKRSGTKLSLWDERGEVQKRRNMISHKGSLSSSQDCQFAIDVAEAILNELLPDVLTSLNLHLQNKVIVE